MIQKRRYRSVMLAEALDLDPLGVLPTLTMGSPSQAENERNHGLDLLRGLCAIGVASSHVAWVNHGVDLASLASFGVYVFFVLSSLTMMLVYSRSFSTSVAWPDLRRFFWNRITKIIPLLAAVATFNFALGAFWYGLPDPVAGEVKAFLTGSALFALHLPGFLSNSVGAWSLGIEGMFYALFPIVCLIAMNSSLLALITGTAVLIVAQHGVLILIAPFLTDSSKHWHYYTTPVMFAPFFALGLIAFRWKVRSSTIALGGCLVSLAVIAGYSLIIPVRLFDSHLSFLFLTGVAFAAALLGYRARLFNGMVPIAELIGAASYSLYLTHWFTLLVWNKVCRLLGAPVLAATISFVPVALLLAYACFRAFELPVQTLMRGAAGKRSGVDPPSGHKQSVAVLRIES
ncbi:MAG TPA: acyltransferase [Xanthobacteraceae bacterium]